MSRWRRPEIELGGEKTMAEGPGRHDVAIVSTAVHQVEAFTEVNEVQVMVDLINQAREAAGLE